MYAKRRVSIQFFDRTDRHCYGKLQSDVVVVVVVVVVVACDVERHSSWKTLAADVN
jgi:hypothetical protein